MPLALAVLAVEIQAAVGCWTLSSNRILTL